MVRFEPKFYRVIQNLIVPLRLSALRVSLRIDLGYAEGVSLNVTESTRCESQRHRARSSNFFLPIDILYIPNIPRECPTRAELDQRDCLIRFINMCLVYKN